MQVKQLGWGLGLAAVVSLLGACSAPVQIGQPLPKDFAQDIQVGMLQPMVREMLGKPMLIGEDDEGLETWDYYYILQFIPSASGKQGEFQHLKVKFRNGLVVSRSYEMKRPE